MGGTNVNVYIRLHDGENATDEILLDKSLTHNDPFEAGHTDVFEIVVPNTIQSPDRIEIFHNGRKHDGLYLKWVEIMNMKTLERKWFEYNFRKKKIASLRLTFVFSLRIYRVQIPRFDRMFVWLSTDSDNSDIRLVNHPISSSYNLR